MGSYTPSEVLITTGLDQVALKKGLERFPGEAISSLRRRVVLETLDPTSANRESYYRSLNRYVAKFDLPVFEIDTVGTLNDPFIEITAFAVRAYTDHDAGTLDFEVNLADRSSGYFLRDVKSAFDASSNFSLTVLDSGYTYKRANRLRIGTTLRYVASELLYNSHSNKLKHGNIKTLHPNAPELFLNPVSSAALVANDGDYYLDAANGVIFTANPMYGTVSYTYREFPYRFYYQPVRAWPLSDSDRDLALKDDLISDTTGAAAPMLLNSLGAELYNELLQMHALSWGD